MGRCGICLDGWLKYKCKKNFCVVGFFFWLLGFSGLNVGGVFLVFYIISDVIDGYKCNFVIKGDGLVWIKSNVDIGGEV